jgi:hypothetical protein
VKNAPDALAALQAAQKASQDRAKREKKLDILPPPPDLDHAEALVQLCIYMYATGCTFGMGTLPDGSGIYGRLRMPGKSDDVHAGMVAFLVSDDPLGVLLKTLAALDAPAKPPYWKPDQYAQH